MKTPTELALGKAAEAWTKEKTSHKEMDSDLAMEFAKILDEIWSKPWLGNATTAMLIDELRARAEVGGYANYKTVQE